MFDWGLWVITIDGVREHAENMCQPKEGDNKNHKKKKYHQNEYKARKTDNEVKETCIDWFFRRPISQSWTHYVSSYVSCMFFFVQRLDDSVFLSRERIEILFEINRMKKVSLNKKLNNQLLL